MGCHSLASAYWAATGGSSGRAMSADDAEPKHMLQTHPSPHNTPPLPTQSSRSLENNMQAALSELVLGRPGLGAAGRD